MQSIATASRFQVHQRQGKIIAAQKPGKCPRGFRLPLSIPVCAPGRKAGRDASGGLQGLLIEGARRLALVTKARRADRPEEPITGGLQRYEPT
jgi:hypothetical protein